MITICRPWKSCSRPVWSGELSGERWEFVWRRGWAVGLPEVVPVCGCPLQIKKMCFRAKTNTDVLCASRCVGRVSEKTFQAGTVLPVKGPAGGAHRVLELMQFHCQHINPGRLSFFFFPPQLLFALCLCMRFVQPGRFVSLCLHNKKVSRAGTAAMDQISVLTERQGRQLLQTLCTMYNLSPTGASYHWVFHSPDQKRESYFSLSR